MISNYDYLGGCYRRFCRRPPVKHSRLVTRATCQLGQLPFSCSSPATVVGDCTRPSKPARTKLCIIDTYHQRYKHRIETQNDEKGGIRFETRYSAQTDPILHATKPRTHKSLRQLIPSHASRFNQNLNNSTNLTKSVTYSLPNH